MFFFLCLCVQSSHVETSWQFQNVNRTRAKRAKKEMKEIWNFILSHWMWWSCATVSVSSHDFLFVRHQPSASSSSSSFFWCQHISKWCKWRIELSRPKFFLFKVHTRFSSYAQKSAAAFFASCQCFHFFLCYYFFFSVVFSVHAISIILCFHFAFAHCHFWRRCTVSFSLSFTIISIELNEKNTCWNGLEQKKEECDEEEEKKMPHRQAYASTQFIYS